MAGVVGDSGGSAAASAAVGDGPAAGGDVVSIDSSHHCCKVGKKKRAGKNGRGVYWCEDASKKVAEEHGWRRALCTLQELADLIDYQQFRDAFHSQKTLKEVTGLEKIENDGQELRILTALLQCSDDHLKRAHDGIAAVHQKKARKNELKRELKKLPSSRKEGKTDSELKEELEGLQADHRAEVELLSQLQTMWTMATATVAREPESQREKRLKIAPVLLGMVLDNLFPRTTDVERCYDEALNGTCPDETDLRDYLISKFRLTSAAAVPSKIVQTVEVLPHEEAAARLRIAFLDAAPLLSDLAKHIMRSHDWGVTEPSWWQHAVRSSGLDDGTRPLKEEDQWDLYVVSCVLLDGANEEALRSFCGDRTADIRQLLKTVGELRNCDGHGDVAILRYRSGIKDLSELLDILSVSTGVSAYPDHERLRGCHSRVSSLWDSELVLPGSKKTGQHGNAVFCEDHQHAVILLAVICSRFSLAASDKVQKSVKAAPAAPARITRNTVWQDLPKWGFTAAYLASAKRAPKDHLAQFVQENTVWSADILLQIIRSLWPALKKDNKPIEVIGNSRHNRVVTVEEVRGCARAASAILEGLGLTQAATELRALGGCSLVLPHAQLRLSTHTHSTVDDLFVPRNQLLCDIAAHLSTSAKSLPYGLLLNGPTGLGKSATAVQIACHRALKDNGMVVVAHHFCNRLMQTTLSPEAFVDGLLQQLRWSLPGRASYLHLKDAYASHLDPQEKIRRLCNGLRSIGASADLGVIVVDALDETLTLDGSVGSGTSIPDLTHLLARHLPPRYSILATSQPDKRVTGKLDQWTTLELDCAKATVDMVAYFQRMCRDHEEVARPFAEEISHLAAKCEGNFYVAKDLFSQVINGSRSTIVEEDINAETFAHHLSTFERCFGKMKKYRRCQRLFEILAAKVKPMAKEDLFIVLRAAADAGDKVLTPPYEKLDDFEPMWKLAVPFLALNPPHEVDSSRDDVTLFRASLLEWLTEDHKFTVDVARGHRMLARAALGPPLFKEPPLDCCLLAGLHHCSQAGEHQSTLVELARQQEVLRDSEMPWPMAAFLTEEAALLWLQLGADPRVHIGDGSFLHGLIMAKCKGAVKALLKALLEAHSGDVVSEVLEERAPASEQLIRALITLQYKEQHPNWLEQSSSFGGPTALQVAARVGVVEIVNVLLAHNATLEICSEGGLTPLHDAAVRGYKGMVARLLELGVNVDAATVDGCTALAFACSKGHTDIVDLLLEKGADPFIELIRGTPACIAAFQGRVECVRLIFRKQPSAKGRLLREVALSGNVDCLLALLRLEIPVDVTYDDRTALQVAAVKGHLDIARALLRADANPNYIDTKYERSSLHRAAPCSGPVTSLLLKNGAKKELVDINGATALHFAANFGIAAAVQALLTANADANVKDADSRTPLYLAAHEGHVEVIRLLLEKNADLRGSSNRIPLCAAAAQGHTEAAQVLLENGADPNCTIDEHITPLFMAAYEGNVRLCRLLLERKANPCARRTDGWTPLHAAVDQGHTEAARVLLENGAEKELVDINGATALHFAARSGIAAAVQALLTANADANVKDADSRTPLYLAAHEGHVEVIRLLLEKNADLRGSSNRIPLCAAAYQGHTEAAQVLLENGADPNCTIDEQETPLFVAAYQGNVRLCRLLLERKANPCARRTNGYTPLHAAVDQGHTEAARVLLENGADPHYANCYGETPLDFAAHVGNVSMCRLLLLSLGTPLESKTAGVLRAIAEVAGHKEVGDLLDAFVAAPLHFAAERGDTAAVQRLLSNGVPANTLDGQQRSALTYAVLNRHAAVVVELRRGGATLDEKLVALATKRGHTDVVAALQEPLPTTDP